MNNQTASPLPPAGAQYLLRFDDLCPTMDRTRWRRYLPILERFSICPILAVVPDNQDPELRKNAPDDSFWGQMRELQSAGATIGLHGYQHRCFAAGRSLVDLHHRSEFAGVPLEVQRSWIRNGMQILRRQGLQPRVWVAPRHGFDGSTLIALREQGIDMVSDGFATLPHRRAEMIWFPQQLWAPVVRDHGLWTIACHPNTASDNDVKQLEEFVQQCHSSFTSIDRALEEWPIRERRGAECLAEKCRLVRLQLSKRYRQFLA